MASKRRQTKTRRGKGQGGAYPIRKNGKVVGWQAAVVINGRRIRRNAPDRAGAEALAKALIAKRDAEIDVEGAAQTVQHWANEWLAQKARKLAPKTLQGYRMQFETYILPGIGTMALEQVRARHLQALLNSVQDDIQAHTRFDGADTVRKLGQLLKQLFAAAVALRKLSHTPMDGVELPAHQSAVIEPPTEQQIRAILEIAVNEPDAALWHCYALLGVRRGEALGVRWQDVDMDAGTIRIEQQVQEVGGKLMFGPPKRGSARTLPAPFILLRLLRDLKPRVLAKRLKQGAAWTDHDLVFCNDHGGPLWPRNVERRWYTLRHAAGVDHTITLHSLRHAVATLLDESGASEALKADILGHGKKSVTQRYTRGRLAAMRRVLDTVARKILEQAA